STNPTVSASGRAYGFRPARNRRAAPTPVARSPARSKSTSRGGARPWATAHRDEKECRHRHSLIHADAGRFAGLHHAEADGCALVEGRMPGLGIGRSHGGVRGAEHAPRSPLFEGRFGRMFRRLRPAIFSEAALHALATLMVAPAEP